MGLTSTPAETKTRGCQVDAGPNSRGPASLELEPTATWPGPQAEQNEMARLLKLVA